MRAPTWPGRRLDEDATSRLVLSHVAEPGDEALGAAVRDRGAVAALAAVEDGSLEAQQIDAYRVRLAGVDLAAALQVAALAGARLLLPGDAEWPPGLDDLGAARPLVLWVAGAGDLQALTGRAVAVVGARACTAYGETVAAEMASALCDRGWTVVSGGAYGVDAAAHRGVLAVGGVTVAVLACGIDLAYPTAHHHLLAAVRERGAVVSEQPPGSRPTRTRFLQRNRLIAAMTAGTVVVEAAIRSGARNTAGHADGLSRAVMAVPGPVTSPMSAGCHEMLRNEGAVLVENAAQVVDVVGDLGADALPAARGPGRPHDDLDPAAMRVLDALPVRRWAAPDAVGRLAGLGPPVVLRALGDLGGRGLAEQRDGTWRRLL